MRGPGPWLTTVGLSMLLTAASGCPATLAEPALEFEPSSSWVFYNWFGGQITVSLEDDRGQRLSILMVMDCDDNVGSYEIFQGRHPIEGAAAVRFVRTVDSLPQLWIGELGTVEIVDTDAGETAVTLDVVLVDTETGARTVLAGTFPIDSSAMS